MKIVFAAILENLSTRNDDTIKIVLGSQEMDADNVGKLFQLKNKYCKVLITNNNISPLEERLIDEEKVKDGKKVKTKSQRLRNVFYRLWEQHGAIGSFDEYYDSKMESVIEHYRAKLDA